MSLDPQTFRDHLLSIYQSAIESAVREQLPPDAPRPGLENETVRAAAQVATLQNNGLAIPVQAPPHIAEDAWDTARLAYELLQAKLAGNEEAATAIAAEIGARSQAAGLLAIAIMIADHLAFWFLGARVVQSTIPLASISPIAVSLRFTAFAVQLSIGVYWPWKLMNQGFGASNMQFLLRVWPEADPWHGSSGASDTGYGFAGGRPPASHLNLALSDCNEPSNPHFLRLISFRSDGHPPRRIFG